MSERVHTFLVRGGQPVVFKVPGNGVVSHSGDVSLFNLVLTSEGAQQIETLLRHTGARVEVTSDWESVEQTQQRDALAVVQDPSRWPTAVCGPCFWLDPTLPGLCGLLGWEASRIAAALDFLPKAKADASTCPINTEKL